MKVLITGGAGYIGSHVCNLLLDKGFDVTVIDNLITGNKKLVPEKAKLIISDIADEKKIKNLLSSEKFDLLMHFAGLIRVDESVKNPKKYNEFNFEKAKTFLNICFQNKLTKVIFSSTASVYGNPNKQKVLESDKLNPLNPYAASKLNLEEFIKAKSDEINIKYIILRYFNVAGADEKLRSGLISKFSSHLIKIACEVAVGKREKIIINGNDYDTFDGTPVRDYIHVTDLSDIHLISAKYLVEGGKSNIFNCGYGKGYSVKEVVENFNQILDKKINFEIGPRRDGDSKMIVANSDKFNEFFSWRPKFNDIKYILKTALEWEKKIKQY
ncbi:MAG: UDP-glucose 4-epimerase GalE [Verrucomicrobia bacterium TMED56]|nr:MAG: UDP-glucose 4-epimerase GalE [Verrucomicrobia bacterium TMED56]|tara:strand:+ start:214 stop:1194 length:981 start_codon:yes stop_codon:yes gene_type:complete